MFPYADCEKMTHAAYERGDMWLISVDSVGIDSGEDGSSAAISIHRRCLEHAFLAVVQGHPAQPEPHSPASDMHPVELHLRLGVHGDYNH